MAIRHEQAAQTFYYRENQTSNEKMDVAARDFVCQIVMSNVKFVEYPTFKVYSYVYLTATLLSSTQQMARWSISSSRGKKKSISFRKPKFF